MNSWFTIDFIASGEPKVGHTDSTLWPAVPHSQTFSFWVNSTCIMHHFSECPENPFTHTREPWAGNKDFIWTGNQTCTTLCNNLAIKLEQSFGSSNVLGRETCGRIASGFLWRDKFRATDSAQELQKSSLETVLSSEQGWTNGSLGHPSPPQPTGQTHPCCSKTLGTGLPGQAPAHTTWAALSQLCPGLPDQRLVWGKRKFWIWQDVPAHVQNRNNVTGQEQQTQLHATLQGHKVACVGANPSGSKVVPA